MLELILEIFWMPKRGEIRYDGNIKNLCWGYFKPLLRAELLEEGARRRIPLCGLNPACPCVQGGPPC